MLQSSHCSRIASSVPSGGIYDNVECPTRGVAFDPKAGMTRNIILFSDCWFKSPLETYSCGSIFVMNTQAFWYITRYRLVKYSICLRIVVASECLRLPDSVKYTTNMRNVGSYLPVDNVTFQKTRNVDSTALKTSKLGT